MSGEPDHRVGRGRPHLLAVRIGNTERGGHLLQRDHHRDARGEAFDDGNGQITDVAAEPGERHPDQQQTGQQPHHQHTGAPELVHDGEEHDRHSPCRSRNLQVRAAEYRRQSTGHHRRDQPGLSAHAGGDPERQCQRQRHDRDRDPGHEVPARSAPQRVPIRALRQQVDQPPGHAATDRRGSPAQHRQLLRLGNLHTSHRSRQYVTIS
jgi:hypothetical protein